MLELDKEALIRDRAYAIWEASGHWQMFAEHMFAVAGDDEGKEAALKPVSCPGHLMMARRLAPSYRDLPLRFGEIGVVHRNEQSMRFTGCSA